MKRFILYLSVLILGLAELANAQNITVSLPDTSVATGAQSLNIPVQVQNFNNIGAISLKINYNPAVLEFSGIANAQTSGFTANADTVNGVIAIGWFSSDGKTPLNVGSGKLLDLKFNFTTGTSSLNFVSSQCEISDISNSALTVNYSNGSVSNPSKISLGNVKTSAGDTVRVPLKGFNLINVGSISLRISYNTSVLQYVGIESDSVGFTPGNSGGTLSLGWASLNNQPLNVSDGVLAQLVFVFTDNSSALTFLTSGGQSEVTDISNNVMNVSFVNGSVYKDVSVSLPTLIAKSNTDVTFGMDVSNLKVGSASLKLNFDPSVLTYKNISVLDTVGGNVSANASNGVLTIGYYNATPQFMSGKLLNIVFTYNGGTSSLSFDQANSEFTDESGTVYSGITYVDGKVLANQAPVFVNTLPDTAITGGFQTLTFQYTAMDADNQTLTFALASGPSGATVTSDGKLTWAAPNVDSTFMVVASVTDGIAFAYDTAMVTVTKNKAPYFTSVLNDVSVMGRDSTLKFQYQAKDPENQPLTFGLVKAASGMTITSAGAFTYAPPLTHKDVKVTAIVFVKDKYTTVYDTAVITVTPVTGIKQEGGLPTKFDLSQNYPNPFNPSTSIKFSVPQETKVVLKIYNLLGQEVYTLVNRDMSAGYYNYEFNANNLPSGIYIYRLQAGSFQSIRKMTLLK